MVADKLLSCNPAPVMTLITAVRPAHRKLLSCRAAAQAKRPIRKGAAYQELQRWCPLRIGWSR
jgi:hypothetical protein